MDSLGIKESLDLFADQCRQVIHEVSLQHIPHDCYLVHNIVIAGMGGSALGGRVLASIEKQSLRIPIIVCSEYSLPNFVNEKTLVILSSYSGNTAETINCLNDARARNAQIMVLTTGGKLADLAKEYDLPGYIFDPQLNPSGMPRMGLGYNLVALLTLLSRCQLIHPAENLNYLPEFLKSEHVRNPEIEKLAKQLVDRIPVFISSEHLKGATTALRNQLNENAKTFCATFDLPEANHHLLEGLRFPRTNPEQLSAVFIESDLYSPQLKQTYSITKDVFLRNHIPVHTLKLDAPSRLFEAISLVQIGGYLAYFMSQINDVDPGPIPFVDFLKDEMHKLS